MHRIYWEHGLPPAGAAAVVEGEEAAHALRVKRVRIGERVELMDGVGGVASCVVERAEGGKRGVMEVRVEGVRREGEARPRVEVWAATPKGGRVDEMVEGLSEVGVAAWVPLRAERSVVEPRESKLERLARVATESAKQCGRAWRLAIDRERGLDDALVMAEGVAVVMADASGERLEEGWGTGAGLVRVLVGPEGGWTGAEVERARAAGARVARFGPHAMRIETAAVVAAGVVIDRVRSAPGQG